MQVTRALEYANRSMVLLASHYGKGPMLVARIAELAAAPPTSLHRVLGNLSRSGLVICRRGAQRGYELARPPDQISLLEVFEAIKGPLGITSCTVEGGCPEENGCTLSTAWHGVQDAVKEQLESATLDRLAGTLTDASGCPNPVE